MCRYGALGGLSASSAKVCSDAVEEETGSLLGWDFVTLISSMKLSVKLGTRVSDALSDPILDVNSESEALTLHTTC